MDPGTPQNLKNLLIRGWGSKNMTFLNQYKLISKNFPQIRNLFYNLYTTKYGLYAFPNEKGVYRRRSLLKVPEIGDKYGVPIRSGRLSVTEIN